MLVLPRRDILLLRSRTTALQRNLAIARPHLAEEAEVAVGLRVVEADNIHPAVAAVDVGAK